MADTISGIGIQLVLETSQFRAAIAAARQELQSLGQTSGGTAAVRLPGRLTSGPSTTADPSGGLFSGGRQQKPLEVAIAGVTGSGASQWLGRIDRQARQQNVTATQQAERGALPPPIFSTQGFGARPVRTTAGAAFTASGEYAEGRDERRRLAARNKLSAEMQAETMKALPPAINRVFRVLENVNRPTTGRAGVSFIGPNAARFPPAFAASATPRTAFQNGPAGSLAELRARYPRIAGNEQALASMAYAEANAGRGGDVEGITAQRTRIEQLRLQSLGQTGLLPARTPRGGVASLFGQGPGGRTAEVRRQAEANIAIQHEVEAYRTLEPLQSKYNRYVKDQGEALAGGAITRKQYNENLVNGRKDIRGLVEAEQNYAQAQVVTDQKVKAAQVGIGAIGKNILAVTGGLELFSLASKALQPVMDAIGSAAGNIVDQFTGFPAAANKATVALAQQNIALHGNETAALAATAAQAGLSDQGAALIAQQLGPAGNAKAGAITGQRTSDLFRAALGAGGQPQGLYGGYGGLLGSSLLGSQLGGGPGFAEVIGNTLGILNANPTQPSILQQTLGAQFGKGSLPAQAAGVAGGIFGVVNQTPVAGDILRALTGGAVSAIAQTPTGKSGAQYVAAARNTESYVSTFNDAAKRAATYMGQSADSAYHFSRALSGQADAVAQSGLPQELKDIAAQGYVLTDAQGHLLLQTNDTDKALGQMAQGLQLPTVKEFVDQQAQALRAQRESAAITAETQRNVLIPGALGAQLGAQPLGPAAAGIVQVNPQVKATVAEAQRQQDALTTDAAAALKVQAQWIDSLTGQGAEYTQLIQQAGQYGQQIASINAQSATISAAASQAEYANNLRLSRRAISDASGALAELSSHSMDATKNLGALQTQEFLLGRESQQLGFQLSQRQINFQVAVAGFSAPGLTSEERAARIKEAQVEAAFAQKQLNIQEQQFAVSGNVFTVQAQRALEDATKAQAVMAQQYAANQQIAANAKLTAALQLRQQQLVDKANTILNNAQGNFDQALSTATAYVTQFGQTVKGVIGQIFTAEGLPNPYTSGGGGTGKPPAKGNTNPIKSAPGYSGSVSVPTQFIAGDAGTEHVLVLRNPVAGTMVPKASPMGGGGNVNVNFINPSVRTDADLRELKRFVLQVLNDKAALMGLRGGIFG